MELSDELDFWTLGIGLLGGIAIFLYGMEKMSDSLKALAGDGMRKILAKLTGNRFMAAATGAFVTAVIQSSSVTTVLVVGFISAGLLTLSQSVGVIMGANVGTTITAQIIAFKVTEYALLLVGIGFAGSFFSKRSTVRLVGLMIFGLGLIFLGMDLMSGATDPLRSFPPFIDLMGRMESPALGIVVGAAFTALVQSSSATTGIVIVLASQGFITLEAGIALSLGANIGTCVTALLSTLGKPRTALQAALVHVIFNVLGALIWLPLIPLLAEWARAFSPATDDLTGLEQLAADVPRQIANAHTIFNVGSTVILIGFSRWIARLVERLVPISPEPQIETAKPRYLEEVYLETPALALDRLRLEIGHMGDLIVELLRKGLKEERTRLKERIADIESLQDQILEYFRRIDVNAFDRHGYEERDLLLESANQVYSIADSIGSNFSPLLKRWAEHDFVASEETIARVSEFAKAVVVQVESSVSAIRTSDAEAALAVVKTKSEIRNQADELRSYLGTRLGSLGRDELAKYRVELAMVEILQQVFDSARRGAKAVLAMHEQDQNDVGAESDPPEVKS